MARIKIILFNILLGFGIVLGSNTLSIDNVVTVSGDSTTIPVLLIMMTMLSRFS